MRADVFILCAHGKRKKRGDVLRGATVWTDDGVWYCEKEGETYVMKMATVSCFADGLSVTGMEESRMDVWTLQEWTVKPVGLEE